MVVNEIKNDNGIVVGKIECVDGTLFLVCTGNAPVYLKGKLLSPTNKFGKKRAYLVEDYNDITY